MYITPNGRIVTQDALPWSAVEMIRRNNDGYIIDKDTVGQGQRPAPGDHKRVRSRDSMGEKFPLNNPRMPMPTRTIITKAGEVHRSGFNNMLERMCTGSPQQQHIQLQMLKGPYKTKFCTYVARGKCNAGDNCCFLHNTDDEHKISQRVKPLRKEVFMRLWEQKFALPIEHLHEIGKRSDQEFGIQIDKRSEHEAHQRRIRPRRSRSAMSSESREYRTPTPSRDGHGNPLPVADANENNDERQRRFSPTGDSDDSDREQAAAQLEANDDDIKVEIVPETERTPLVGKEDIEEPTPQLMLEDADTAMSLDPPIVEAVEAAEAETDMATGRPENIVDV